MPLFFVVKNREALNISFYKHLVLKVCIFDILLYFSLYNQPVPLDLTLALNYCKKAEVL